jgi:cobalt/nickel transport protein
MKQIYSYFSDFVAKLFFGVCIFLISSQLVKAHFQELIPTSDIVIQETVGTLQTRNFSLSLRFTHPMDNGPLMEMAKPLSFGVMINGKKRSLKASLTPFKQANKTTWLAPYKLQEPGDHIFYVSPALYWEPGEEKMIQHHTKVVVDGFGGGEGWDKLVGLPVEIEPLSRPYGLWTHNSFTGRVLKAGKPVPFAIVEVEYRNDRNEVHVPFAAYSTQVIKTDGHGVFSYGLPRAGWWGFAALTTRAEKAPNPKGELTDVEEAGVIWVFARDMISKKHRMKKKHKTLKKHGD